MSCVLASIALIGSDINKPIQASQISQHTIISFKSCNTISCWTHHKERSELHWKQIKSGRQEAAAEASITNLAKLIATIYTKVETFASIWAYATLTDDIAKHDIGINQDIYKGNSPPCKQQRYATQKSI